MLVRLFVFLLCSEPFWRIVLGCVPVQGPSLKVSGPCGDGVVNIGEECDDGNRVYGDGCQGNCRNPVCGDGSVDQAEQCDDGNTINGDGCQANCREPQCGDGIVDVMFWEECDDGNTVAGDGTCQAHCKLPVCGDGVVDTTLGEQCDDGNRAYGDGCQGNCLNPVCGDGAVDSGEQCDDGNNNNADGCQGNCMFPRCGDGIIDIANSDQCEAEQCDDGNNIDADGTCQGNCKLPVCGDGIVDAILGEQCDDGNRDYGDGCQGNCRIPFCGDGTLDSGEQCDDGNNIDADGCQGNCLLPKCGDGIMDMFLGEECDDDNNVDNDMTCQGNCKLPMCGDKIVDTTLGEECDDGNTIFGDGCQGNCLNPVCGDGITDFVIGEQCDDGNTDDNFGPCPADCILDCSFESCVDNNAGFGAINNPCPSPDCTQNGCQCAMTNGNTLNVAIGACPFVSAIAVNAPDGSCTLNQIMEDFTLSCAASDITAVGPFDSGPPTTQIPMVTKIGCSCPASCQDTAIFDLLLIADTSGSVEDTEWPVLQDVMQLLVSSFTIGIPNVQVAGITFSTNPMLEWNFNLVGPAAPATQSLPGMLTAIDSMTYTGLEDDIGLALNMAQATFLTGRPNPIPEIAVVFTDATVGITTSFGNIRPAATTLQASGATILAVGIGADQAIMDAITLDNALNQFTIANFDNLMPRILEIVERICAIV